MVLGRAAPIRRFCADDRGAAARVYGTMALRTIVVVCPAVTVTRRASVIVSSLGVPFGLTVTSWGVQP